MITNVAGGMADLAAQAGEDLSSDPVQAYCVLLHHRWALSTGAERAISTEYADRHWTERGRPGRPVAENGEAPGIETI